MLCYGFLSPIKVHHSQLGLNSWTFGLMASTITIMRLRQQYNSNKDWLAGTYGLIWWALPKSHLQNSMCTHCTSLCARYKGAAGMVPQECDIVGTCAGRVRGLTGSGPSHRGSLLTTVTSMDSPVTRPCSLTAVPIPAIHDTTMELLPLSDEKQCSSPQDNYSDQGNGMPSNYKSTAFL
jgi:hypothetical protein